jgi:transcription-repair coupling factor (superfamily II helicase)
MSRLPIPPLPDPARAFLERGRARRIALGGVYGSMKALLLAEAAAAGPVFALVPDVVEAEAIEDDLRAFAGQLEAIVFKPADQESLDTPEARAEASERLAQLLRLHDPKRAPVVVAPVALLLEALPRRDSIDDHTRRFAVGETLDVAELRRLALSAGFMLVPMVASPAEISVRGDIVDVFPLGEDQPLRIELFDDVIESIRVFEPETQRSQGQRREFRLPLLKPTELARAIERRSFLDQELAPGTLVLRFEPDALRDRLSEHAFAFEVDKGARVRAETVLKEGIGIDVHGPRVAEGDDGANLDVLSVQGFGGGIDHLPQSVATLRQHVDRVVLFAESDAEIKRVAKLLQERDLMSDAIALRRGRVRSGFQDRQRRVAVLNFHELLGKPRIWRPKPKKPAVPARAISNLLELNEGDYVVHLTHGIARYRGLIRMKRDLGEEDFLVLEFDGGTTYYLPAAKIDLVQRYIGTGAEAPKLDKIGGKSWANKKAKVQSALLDIADRLLEVQAARELRPGLVHRKDDPLVEEFERSFPFVDTPDQSRTMREIHADFDGDKPMDRLLCGDVGFGKTEMALRAAFRVVLGGRQVAVLVPTTLLAEQHYQTIASRFANYPVRAAVLSRFQSSKAQKAAVDGARSGSIDILVGTHRLLSKDVHFKELGLVVIDEEQRFGVKAKEALKALRANVDVLTLTATPIPRTLHMAMVGIRAISSLNTPPAGRRPVRTEIRRFDDDFIRRAILHEQNRGGQVFFVHNRVAHLERIAERLLKVAPSCRPVLAHGQMDERSLEDALRAFAAGEADVLVSTNIIEAGLDLPRANTIFIDHPEMFGLADLHQLRGRVGRSDKQAYCYLLIGDGPLQDDAERRLRAVEELAHLGAGYDLSIRDLEIRGAGNLVGAEQSGTIAAVGYDLYVQLLRRAIHKARGTPPPPEPVDTDIDLGVDAFLPVEYVPDSAQRMELLRRLGAPDGPPLSEMEAELRDRFGRVPKAARQLLMVFALKRRLRELGVRRMLYPGGRFVFLDVDSMKRFQKDSPFQANELVPQSAALIHLRLPQAVSTNEQILYWLAERMLARAAAETR